MAEMVVAEMVASAVVQETVSGVFSYISTNGEDQKVSEKHDMERLEMAYTELKWAVERSAIMPITEVSLLERRKMIKRKYEECGDLLQLHRCKIRVAEDKDESSEQGVITRFCSFPGRIVHAAKSFFWSSPGLESSCSAAVRRFERLADKAGQFVRDVETGCSLAHYRFFTPLNRHLLEGKNISYKMVQASQTIKLDIIPMFLEGRGCEAWIEFSYEDSMMPLKCFVLSLSLRLSGSMDIVGITSKCLQLSLGPRFKSLAEDAMGKLAQIPTQDAICSAITPGQFKSPKHGALSRILAAAFAVSSLDHPLDDLLLEVIVHQFDALQFVLRDAMHAVCARRFRPDPVCCTANGHGHRGNDIISSKLSYQFPEEVNHVRFKSSYITAPDFNYLSNSTNVVSSTNIVGGWPLAHLSVFFVPHCYCPRQKDRSYETTGGGDEDLRQMVEIVIPESIDNFIRYPELSYRGTSCQLQARGYAFFTGKIASNIGKCTTNANSMSRPSELIEEFIRELIRGLIGEILEKLEKLEKRITFLKRYTKILFLPDSCEIPTLL